MDDFASGLIAGIVASTLVYIASPLVDRIVASIKASWTARKPLSPDDVPKVKERVKTLKKDLESITTFKKSIPDLYLYVLGEIAYSLMSLMLACLAAIGLGVSYIAVRVGLMMLTEYLEVLAGVGGFKHCIFYRERFLETCERSANNP